MQVNGPTHGSIVKRYHTCLSRKRSGFDFPVGSPSPRRLLVKAAVLLTAEVGSIPTEGTLQNRMKASHRSQACRLHARAQRVPCKAHCSGFSETVLCLKNGTIWACTSAVRLLPLHGSGRWFESNRAYAGVRCGSKYPP